MELILDFLFSNLFFLILFLYGIVRFLGRISGERDVSDHEGGPVQAPKPAGPKPVTRPQGRKSGRSAPYGAPNLGRGERLDGDRKAGGAGRDGRYVVPGGSYGDYGGTGGAGEYGGYGVPSGNEGYGGSEGLGDAEGYGGSEGIGGAEGYGNREGYGGDEGFGRAGNRPSPASPYRKSLPAANRPAAFNRSAREGMKWALIFDSPRALKPYRFRSRKPT